MSLFGGVEVVGRPDPNNIRKLDMLPVPMIRKMQRYGIAIDIPYMNSLTSELEKEMDELRVDIACEIPPEDLDKFIGLSSDIDDWSPINVNSGPQLAKLMFDVLGIGRTKKLKMTNTGDRISTGKKQLEVLKGEHKVVDLVLRYRERAKLKSTYTLALPLIARRHPKGYCPICEMRHVEATSRVHTEFTTTRTATGRLASKSPNLQNIPARTKLGRRVRAGFIASPGTRLVSRDFSQIELRLLAHCAQEPSLIDIFHQNQDPHLITACRAFGLDVIKWARLAAKKDAGTLTPAEKPAWDEFSLLYRAPCKNVNFGVVYGLAAAGLFDLMGVTYATAGLSLPEWLDQRWCEKFIEDWFNLYPAVKKYMEELYYRARRYRLAWDLFGRIRRVAEVMSCHRWIQGEGLRQAGNMPIQSAGAGLMKLAMGELDVEFTSIRHEFWVWPLLSIHDELISEVDEDMADGICELKGIVMDNVLIDKQTGKDHCLVPIKSDGHPMDRWAK